MIKQVGLNEARKALKAIVTEDVEGAAGRNGVLSRREAGKLDPFVRRSEVALRKKGEMLRAKPLAAHAVSEAVAKWNEFNPKGPGRAQLSEKEIKAITASDRALGRLTQAVLVRVSKGAKPAPKTSPTKRRAVAPKNTPAPQKAPRAPSEPKRTPTPR